MSAKAIEAKEEEVNTEKRSSRQCEGGELMETIGGKQGVVLVVCGWLSMVASIALSDPWSADSWERLGLFALLWWLVGKGFEK